jgi:hypothetical protein
MVHALRAAMQSLKKTGTDATSAQGMDPKQFFNVVGEYFSQISLILNYKRRPIGLEDVVAFDAKVGGSAFQNI